MTEVNLFYDEQFPFADKRSTKQQLAELQSNRKLVKTEELEELLCYQLRGTPVTLHGPYFPKKYGQLFIHS